MLTTIRRLRIGLVLCALLVVSACGARNMAGPETTFTPASKEALLIGGGISTGSSIFGGCRCPYFSRIDAQTGQPLGNSVSFHSHGDNPSAFIVPAGLYALSSWDDCTKRHRIYGPNLKWSLLADRSEISFLGARTHTINVKPGEVLYIGHFDGSSFRDRSEEAKKLLATMPGVSGPFTFRKPEWGLISASGN